MRLVQACLKDAYKVHKTYVEFLSDIGHAAKDDELYPMWTHRLTDPTHKYVMLMHGKKVIGMAWGREIRADNAFLIEGRFLRRAYRGRYKFTAELYRAVKDISKDFAKVLMLLPVSQGKLKNGKYRYMGTLVELK